MIENRPIAIVFIAIIDMVFAVSLIIFFILQVLYVWLVKQFVIQELSTVQVCAVIIISGVLTFGINSVQIFLAHELFRVTTQEEFVASFCIEKSQLWTRTSIFFFIILTQKLFLTAIVKWSLHDPVLSYIWLLNLLLILLELIFRMVGFHYVRQFIDKLPMIRRVHIHNFNCWNTSSVNVRYLAK